MQAFPDPKTQFIVMTHEGPFLSSTAINAYSEGIEDFPKSGDTYFCGSAHLR